MKDHRAVIINKDVTRLIKIASDLGLDYTCFEGTLTDSYIIYETDRIKFGRCKPRKYIILREVYINEYSSGMEMILSDSLRTVKKYEKILSC